MRIGIVSDTHGLLRKEVIEGLQDVFYSSGGRCCGDSSEDK